jgi:hypothetical protein
LKLVSILILIADVDVRATQVSNNAQKYYLPRNFDQYFGRIFFLREKLPERGHSESFWLDE